MPMLSRRKFSACALCAVAGFSASSVGAEAAEEQQAPGVRRIILQRTEFPGSQYETLLVLAEIDAGVNVAKHTHPGIESAYVLEGGLELSVQGEPTRTLKAGDGNQIQPWTPHSARNGDKLTRIAVTYVLEKGKPIASPA
jgi:quercetin dioxygenase-like cupin family protein